MNTLCTVNYNRRDNMREHGTHGKNKVILLLVVFRNVNKSAVWTITLQQGLKGKV